MTPFCPPSVFLTNNDSLPETWTKLWKAVNVGEEIKVLFIKYVIAVFIYPLWVS